MIKEILIITHKEILLLRGALKKIILLTIFVFSPLAIGIFQNGVGARFSGQVIINYLPCLLGGAIANEMIKNNLSYEKREKTLEILMSSLDSNYAITIGNSLAAVILGGAITLIGELYIFIAQIYYSYVLGRISYFSGTIKPTMWLMMALVIYLLSQSEMIALEICKEERISVFLGVILFVCAFLPNLLLSNMWVGVICECIVAVLYTFVSTHLLKSYLS